MQVDFLVQKEVVTSRHNISPIEVKSGTGYTLTSIQKCIKKFGHNNDLSYRTRYTGVSYKMIATWRRLLDFVSLVPVFPVDAPKFFFTYMFNKAK